MASVESPQRFVLENFFMVQGACGISPRNRKGQFGQRLGEEICGPRHTYREWQEGIAVNAAFANGIGLPWLIFLAYWVVASLRVNRMVRAEPAGDLMARVLLMAAAFVLLFSDDSRFGF